jgi:hypothetical protein
MRIRTAAMLGAALLILPACPAADPHVDLGMSDTTFVHTMVRLYAVAVDTLLDSLARDSARRTALRDMNVTPQQLDTAAFRLAREPKRAESLWSRIDRATKGRNPATP